MCTLMSAPAANALSLPVRTMAPTSSLYSNSSIAAASCLATSLFKAFNCFGLVTRECVCAQQHQQQPTKQELPRYCPSFCCGMEVMVAGGSERQVLPYTPVESKHSNSANLLRQHNRLTTACTRAGSSSDRLQQPWRRLHLCRN